MARCRVCGKENALISKFLGLCKRCIAERFSNVRRRLKNLHHTTRIAFNLPLEPPNTPTGIACQQCVNQCRMGEGESGFCSLRTNEYGKIVQKAGTEKIGFAQYYYDPLPTNCVASWVCPEGKEMESVEDRLIVSPWRREKNLAVFYESCTFNCLFCQNWHYRQRLESPTRISASELASQVDDETSCICYFGGDPASQMAHALKTSKLAIEARKSNPPRICWETNGSMHRDLLKSAAELSLKSGGCVKFDLKAFSRDLHWALTSCSNHQTLSNFKWLAAFAKRRKEPPLLVASTLLVPGYVDEQEIEQLARFIASVNPTIPYSLLAFHPQFYLSDLPTTSIQHAETARDICLQAGLQQVNIGNKHLLTQKTYS